MKSNMTEIIEDLKLQFNNLDTNKKKLDQLASLFIKYGKEDDESIEDLVKLWQHFFQSSNSNNKISFIYLANLIIINSKENNLDFHLFFFKYLLDILPKVYNEISDSEKKEINDLINVWNNKQIFDKKDLEELKEFLNFGYKKDILENYIFIDSLKTGKIKVSHKIIDLCKTQVELNNLTKKNKNEILNSNAMEVENEHLNNEHQGENAHQSNNLENIQDENKKRELILKLLSEKVKEQYQNNIKDLMLLEEVDNMLHKIKTIKKNNGKQK